MQGKVRGENESWRVKSERGMRVEGCKVSGENES